MTNHRGLRTRRLLATALILSAVALGSPAQQASGTTAIYGTVIDGSGAAPILNGVVVVSGERILAVGPVDVIDIPEGATEIRVEDATILPGFIDTHVHKSFNANTLAAWAAAGITTIRDLGWDPAADWDALRDGYAQDPRLATLVIAGPVLTVPDGYGLTHGFPVAVAVASPSDACAVTQSLIRRGVDLIKIAIESTMPRECPAVMPLDIATAIVEAAHSEGIEVVAHAMYADDLWVAVNAGVDQLAHMGRGPIDMDLITRIAEENIHWVTTLYNRSGSIYLRRFAELGGVVTMGTDTGAVGRVDTRIPVDELERMLRSGMDAMSVIVASTRNGALACGLLDETGTLEAGKLADILVVSGDPLVDITVLGDAAFVMHHGHIVHDATSSNGW